MQHEITKPIPLLDSKGHLSEPGFAKDMLWEYNRKSIKASGWRIKEWDYYYIINNNYAVALTIADNSYMGLDSISFLMLDKDNPWEVTKSPMQFFTFGSKKLPASSVTGDIHSEGKGFFIDFKNNGDSRRLSFHMDNFKDGQPIDGDITLSCPKTESMVIATPFPDRPESFYYNQKINCMPADGYATLGDELFLFKSESSAAGLDWGRGVWTYKNTWYWGSASGFVGNKRFGFNIGYGFGDTKAASENMLFYDGKAHKLSNIKFNIPVNNGKDDFMSPWTFTSDDGRFEMDFIPILDRFNKTDLKLICSDQHQVFGRFTGKAVLDDGTVIEIKDFIGFAEKVFNKW